MNYELELLEKLVDWLKAEPSINRQENLLRDETKRIEKSMLYHIMNISNKTRLNTYLQVNLSKLVEICDDLFIPGSDENYYAQSVLDLLIAVRKTAGALAPQDLQLPFLLRRVKGRFFGQQYADIKKLLESCNVDHVLIDIIGFAYNNFVNAKSSPKSSQENYLRDFFDTLEELTDKIDNEYLISLLIRLNYNYSRFTAYCYRWMSKKIEGNNMAERSKILRIIKKELRQLELLSKESFDSRKSPIMDELLKWIDEELATITVEDQHFISNPLKINTKLKVLELAYWEKLQYDNGVYDETNLDVLSEKIAHNFSSKYQGDLSAASIKSKFYPKERAIIAPVEELLMKMLKDVRLFLR